MKMLLPSHARWQRTAAQATRLQHSPSSSIRHAVAQGSSRRRLVTTAAGRGAAKAERADEPDAAWDNSFVIEYQDNTNPNFDDDDWYNKVTDWHEFWNHQVWDPAVEALDDEHDAVMQTETSVARANKLLEFIKDFHKREDFVSTFPIVRERDTYNDVYEQTPDFYFPDRQPKVNKNDLRAIVDKRRRKQLFDAEWNRRKAAVGRIPLTRTDQERDIRFGRDGDDWDDVKHDWSEEDIMNLITNNGANADPAKHGVHIDNPLIAVDYTTTYGINYIEETDEFASRIGHWLEDDEMVVQEREIVFTEGDLQDFDQYMEEVPAHNELQMASAVQDWAVQAEEMEEEEAQGGRKRRGRARAAAEEEEDVEEEAGAGVAQTVDLDDDLLADDAEDISNMSSAYGSTALPEDMDL